MLRQSALSGAVIPIARRIHLLSNDLFPSIEEDQKLQPGGFELQSYSPKIEASPEWE
jgi:hypothetical protein